jgi:glutaredoxin
MATNGEKQGTPRITIYTTPTCHWCEVAKRYFEKHRIEFTEVDVTRDRRGMRDMVLMTGGRAVPVVRVGSHAMTGWDAREFEKLRSGSFKRR